MSTHANMVKMTVTSVGADPYTITLNAASSGFQSFADAYGANATVDILITQGTVWEVARNCTYTNSGTTVTRGTFEDSSTGSRITTFDNTAVVSVVATADWGNRLETVLATTSGGVLGSTAAGTPAWSAALAAGELVRGGGAGAVPSTSGAATVTGAAGSTALTLVGGTQTASYPVLDMAQTWNNAGVTFTGIKIAVTPTASGSSSKILDLQVNAATEFSIDRDGIARGVFRAPSTGSATASLQGGALSLASSGQARWTNGDATGAADLILIRGAAATLQLGAANAASPIAQTLRTQGPRGGTDSNTAGATWTLYTGPSTGNATPASVIIQSTVAGASGTTAQALLDTFVVQGGLIRPPQFTTVGAPAAVLGAMYFDTTLNKLRIGGAGPAWETVTSV